MKNNAHIERYQRQVILKELGEAGQDKLLASRVLVVGAGGLGCPVLMYLSAAGIGTLGILDEDIVDISNLHRQVLYTNEDVGKPKSEQAAHRVQLMNPGIDVRVHSVRLTNQNALEIFSGYDVIVDASDNFPTRYLVNDACVLLGKPLVYGAVSRWEGQLAVFNMVLPSGLRSSNYRDLFPTPPRDGEVDNCAEAGVIGVLPGIIGTLQAAEVIKLVAGIQGASFNQLHAFHLLSNEWFKWDITPSANTPQLIPQTKDEFQSMDYKVICGVANVSEITRADFMNLIKESNVTVVDVRHENELPAITDFKHIHIPLPILKNQMHQLTGEVIITVCQSGQRSRQAAQVIAEHFSGKKVYSLKNGLMGWKPKNQIHE